jgi:3-mercaptopyruvate sulfurtransferase SseA
MHHFGVECAILHGGIERWEYEGRPMASDTTSPPIAATPMSLAVDWEKARARSAARPAGQAKFLSTDDGVVAGYLSAVTNHDT